ncbi:MAG TPA: protein kinase [Vicinamibacterales bacterium]|nr:protein kinase [Vicinamibacterales bacterium]
MAMPPGARLGPYEIIDPLGAGGMGEVYRARDTKLGREVAIKVLPELFAADPERLNRFEHEARTLAAFNHQNIAQVHGVIDQPPALVMELVEGDDLASRIAGGPIAVEEAIPIARQIAEGLEAAHERGIIHRDLKPANIKVRGDGVVKVLDFGLAKATAAGHDAGAEAVSPSDSPTFASPAMTRMGVILGTAAYMAPEQAKGKVVDKRADIWAFGCVLYEMLTGRRVFNGESSSELIAAVIMSEPELTSLPAHVPAAIRRLIQRCLEKDPRQRLRDIGEARIALATPLVADAAAAVSGKSAPSVLAVSAWVAGGVLVGAALAWLVSGRTGAIPDSSMPEFSLKRLTELPGAEMHPDISPDGRQVLFTSSASGNRDVYLLRVGGARPINLTARSADDDEQGTFSPDGERIAFRSDRDGGGLFVMGATGESVRRLTTQGFDPAWSPDGRLLAYSTEAVIDPYARNTRAQLWTVEVASGETTRLLEGDAVQPAWSPDGRRLAYWANTGGQRDIWIVDAGGGTPVAVTRDAATDWSPEWSPDGAWLYFSSDRGGTMNLWRLAIDRDSGSASGAPQPITNSFTGIGYARFAADAQRLAVMAYSRSYELSLAPFDSAGGGKVGPETTVRSPSLGWCSSSPSADWLACTSRGAQEDIVLMRPDGSETVRLTDDPVKDRNPTWSPDGSRIGFMSARSGEWELWSVRPDGSDLRQMTDLRADTSVAIWSPDGKQAVTTSSTRPPTGLWLFDTSAMATRQNAKFFESQLPDVFSAESWSPDGRLIAGFLQDSGGYPRTIALWDVATATLRPLKVSLPRRWAFFFVNGGWLPDSRRFLVMSDSGLVLVDSVTGQSTPVQVRAGVRYDLTAAGRTLMVERLLYDADVWVMEVRR